MSLDFAISVREKNPGISERLDEMLDQLGRFYCIARRVDDRGETHLRAYVRCKRECYKHEISFVLSGLGIPKDEVSVQYMDDPFATIVAEM